MKFRKKPVVIEAEQWDGTFNDMKRIVNIFPDMVTTETVYHEKENIVRHWAIRTLARFQAATCAGSEGQHNISVNDFIIRGVKGEYYPCKPDIFEATYEPVT